MILPVLTYGAEIWGYQRYQVAERVQLKYCKVFMGVKSSTPDACILGDCGRYPIFIHTFKKALLYWFKLLKMPTNRVAKHAYELAVTLDKNGKESWATHKKFLLYEHGFGDVWFWQGPGDFDLFLNNFMTRASDIFKQNWFSDICCKSKLRLYCNFKTSFQTEDYLKMDIGFKLKSAFASLRTGGVGLAVEEGRAQGLEFEDRICKVCGSTEIEDEYHFVCICPLYQNLRSTYLPRWAYIFPTPEKYYSLMASNNNQDILKLVLFVYKATHLRKECM